MERHDIRLRRITFLKKMMEYRRQGRPIIYTDETYIHSSYTSSKGWYDKQSKGFMKPVSKGQRLIIVHAGGSTGFVPNALLIFKSGILFFYMIINIELCIQNACINIFRDKIRRLS